MKLTDNIKRVLDQASPEDISVGMEWYRVANTFALGLAEKYDSDLDTTAGVIAAISPRLNWGLNQAYAERMLRDGDAPLLGMSKAKALRIMGGESPDVVFAAPKERAQQGQKIRAFYACILRPNETDAVCVDRHAYDVANNIENALDEDRKGLERKGVYEEIAQAYRDVAKERGLLPWQAQAIAWVTWRRLKGLKDHTASAGLPGAWITKGQANE